MKRCTKCKKLKLESQFSKRRLSKDGLAYRCRKCALKNGRIWYEAHKGLCRKRGRRWVRNHRERVRKGANDCSRKLRQEVMKALGEKCACCGETTPEFLTLDHIQGGGSKHRKRKGNYAILRQIKRAKFPKDKYAILCWNCNWGKHKNKGVCPHKGE